LKLTDHMFPVKLVIGSQVSSFSRGKSRKFCLLTFLFLKGVPAGQGVAWDYSITDFPPVSGPVSGVVLAF
jgi:hypothetical protein